MQVTMPRATPAEAIRTLTLPAVISGLIAGLVMIVVVILVMGTSGMGYATALNVGIPAFVVTVTPPGTLVSSMMGMMTHASSGGHMMALAPAQMQTMTTLAQGHGTNATLAAAMSSLSAPLRDPLMAAMPVNAGHVAIGVILHFLFAAFLGVLFFGVIGAAAWFDLPGMRTRMGMMGAGMLGGALVYVLNRWIFLPPTNSMMAFVPQTAFFLAHLLFGLIVGTGLALTLRKVQLPTVRPSPVSSR